MIPDGAAMMVRLFCRGNFSIHNFCVGVNFFIEVFFFPGTLSRGGFTGKVSQYSSTYYTKKWHAAENDQELINTMEHKIYTFYIHL